LRVGITRGRSCAFVLIIPQRKTRLSKALHGSTVMAGVGVSMGAHGKLTGEGKEGEGGGGEGAQLGRHGEGEGCRRGLLGAAWLGPVLVWPLYS
jgi:hypothetical protein